MIYNDKNKNSMEKELREIIGWNCGGTYKAKLEAVKQILVLFNVSKSFTAKQMEQAYDDGIESGEQRGGVFEIENYR